MVGYPKYKYSGFSWIGDIPEHWEIKRTKYVAKLYNGDSLNDEQKNAYSDFSESDETIPYIASKDIDKDSCSVDYLNGTRIPKKEKNTNGRPFSKAPAGSSLLCIEGGSAGKKRCILDREVNFVNKLCCFVPKINGKFLFYYICSNSYWENFKQNLQGMIGGVTVTKLGTFPIPIPTDSEQKAISDYLDAECRKIDDLIAKEEKRVSLLQEVRLSILTKAVLQGLYDGVETATSKHSWLGNIPKHWKIMPLRYTANAKGCCFIDGDWIESKDIDYDGSIKYLTTGNVGPGFYKEQGLGYITEEKFKELDCIDVLPGDLLISRLNEPIARTCIVPDLGSRIVTAVDNVIFRPNPNVLDRKFACYYMNNGRLTEHANIIARGATMHRISRTMLGHLPIVLPPLDEQREIVAFLDKECGQYANRIAKANHQIDLLKEYKLSLITEVVTGKRKVC